MTSGMRQNWIQAVLKNVRPSLAPDIASSLPEESTQQKSQKPDSQSALGLEKHPDSFLQEHKTSDYAEETLSASSVSPISPPQQVEESEGDSCHQCTLLVDKQNGVTDALLCSERAGSDRSTSTTMQSNDCLEEQADVQSETQPQVKTTTQSDEINKSCQCTKEKENLSCKQQTGQLVKELEQTQKELSRLQQLNRNLEDELQQVRESHLREQVHPQVKHRRLRDIINK
uniref:myosin phosphatase Rho-interacting protein-like n=1 Tax=Scatophagus argus TaxID=75038 RepID=UPI001ED82E4F|nr:myosin phosphatase Rho-interacting protein-like [Scatophagus argus]